MRQLITTETVFQITSMRHMLLNSLLPFVRSTAILQVHSIGRIPSLKAVWTRLMTRYQCPVFGSFLFVAAAIHHYRCCYHIHDVPPYRFIHRLKTAHLTSSHEGTEYLMGNISIYIGTFYPRGDSRMYSAIRSAVILEMVTWAGGRGQLADSL